MLLMAGCSSFERFAGGGRTRRSRRPVCAGGALPGWRSDALGDLAAAFGRAGISAGDGRARKYCRDGYGVERDRDAAIEWWRKAALEKRDLEAPPRSCSENSCCQIRPPDGRNSRVAAYGVLLADPACPRRRKFAERLLEEGEKLRLALRLAERREELAAVEKQFTKIFQQSPECFDLSNPAELELMDKLSDETYRLPPLQGEPPRPPDISGLRPNLRHCSPPATGSRRTICPA